MQSTMRLGVVGLNRRVEQVVLPGLAASPRAVVAALCSRDRAKAEHFASPYPGSRAFGSLAEMLRDAELDALLVLTPTPLHYEMSLAAIDAGLAVCCEKPLAGTLDEATSLA